ncbi:putative hemagglutinin DUF637 [Alteromonadaceae bacterium 2753L.S.0a.02]|nr:putative hemagglutinin DUF637 [Alteromonadaceae bacterium 2753L.S.0a.02]
MMITNILKTSNTHGVRGMSVLKFLIPVATLLSLSAASMADDYLDTDIQSELESSYSIERSSSPEYQYLKGDLVDQIGQQAVSNVGVFHQRLKNGNIAKLPAEQVTDWIPITGSITFFIPKERTDYPLAKRVGDSFVEARLVRSQIYYHTGRHLLTTSFSNEAQQIDALYNNAFALSQKPGFSKKFGDRLTDTDVSSHSLDVIWPELRTINGENVLVPIVHLANDHSVTGHEVSFSGEQAQFKSVNILSGAIITRRNALLATASNFVVSEGAKVLADGNLNMNIGGALLNTGTLSAAEAISITAGNYYQKTLVHRFQTPYGFNERLGIVSSIDATQGITINSMSDITFLGAEAQSGESISFTAAGNIKIGTVTLSRESGYAHRNASYQMTALEHVQSTLSAGDNIELMAGGLIEINASNLYADEGHINLLAGMGITIIDELNQEQMVAHREYGHLTEDESAYATIAMRSVLDAGKGIRIHSAMGDITLRATDIASEEGTSVLASDGTINMLMTVENDHYSYSSIEEKLFTITNKSRGHNYETAVPNTIIGGFAAEALYGVKVQYEGKDGLTFEEQMDAFGDMEGMEWISELRNNPDVDIDWEKIETAYEEWDESNTSLSAAAMIIIMIIVSICTAGAGAALAATMTSTTIAAGSTTAAILNAGFTAMMSTAAAASANATVNGADPLEVFESGYEAVLSQDGARNVATAMVTAGVMSNINAEFFNPAEAGGENFVYHSVTNSAGDVTGYTLSLQGQALQALTSSVVDLGISVAADGGGFSDFKDGLGERLVGNSISLLGSTMTSQISELNLSEALNYVASAGVGCIIGIAQNQNGGQTDTASSDACFAGGSGSVIGTYIGAKYEEAKQRELEEEQLEWLARHGVSNISDLSDLTPIEFGAYQVNIPKFELAEIYRLQSQGVDIARLAGALGALATGLDVELAANAAETSAQYSSLKNFRQTVASVNALNDFLNLEEIVKFQESLLNSDGTRQQYEQLLAEFVALDGYSYLSELSPEMVFSELKDLVTLFGYGDEIGSTFERGSFMFRRGILSLSPVEVIDEYRDLYTHDLRDYDPAIRVAAESWVVLLAGGETNTSDLWEAYEQLRPLLNEDVRTQTDNVIGGILGFGEFIVDDAVGGAIGLMSVSAELSAASLDFVLWQLTEDPRYVAGASHLVDSYLQTKAVLSQVNNLPEIVRDSVKNELSEIETLRANGSNAEASQRETLITLRVIGALWGTGAVAYASKNGVQKFFRSFRSDGEIGAKLSYYDQIPLSAEDVWEIYLLPKTRRPDPSEYLSNEYIANHLSKFKDEAGGVSWLMQKEFIDDPAISPNKVLGRVDGQFVMPKTELDSLLRRTGGDLSKIEAELGIPEGRWQGMEFVRIDVRNPESLNLRMATGNESGAYIDEWLPGGYTPLGIPEAVIDRVPPSAYNMTDLVQAVINLSN